MGPQGAAYKLSKDGQTWLIVAIAGAAFGIVWITGPLAWYMAAQLITRAEQMGVPVPDNVRYAKIAGIITTILAVLSLVMVFFAFVFIFGSLAAFV